MKTPREILLKKHEQANRKLDDLRQDVLGRLNSKDDARHVNAAQSNDGFLLKLWTELILPAQRIWAGVAATWVLIALINAASPEEPPAVPYARAQGRKPSTNVAEVVNERQRVVADLLAGASESEPPQPADRRRDIPTPSSARRITIKLA